MEKYIKEMVVTPGPLPPLRCPIHQLMLCQMVWSERNIATPWLKVPLSQQIKLTATVPREGTCIISNQWKTKR
jgi:hypothetical protein